MVNPVDSSDRHQPGQGGKPVPTTVRIAFSLIFLVALVWVLFGVIVVARLHPALPDLPAIRWGIGLTAILAGVILAGLDVLLLKRNRFVYWALLVGLIVLALATFLDQFGWVDLLILLFTLVPAVLLIRDRKWYLQARSRK
jgi:lysylphosphatidylglycerol synthetase-like protein (DUF2156 family)